MNRKGQFSFTRKMVYWSIALFLIVILAMTFSIGLFGYDAKLVKVPDQFRAEMIAMRFVNIPECFAFADATTGRVYPGVLDTSKFTQEQLEGCYQVSEVTDYGFRLAVKDMELMTRNYANVDDFSYSKKVEVDGVVETMKIFVQKI